MIRSRATYSEFGQLLKNALVLGSKQNFERFATLSVSFLSIRVGEVQQAESVWAFTTRDQRVLGVL